MENLVDFFTFWDGKFLIRGITATANQGYCFISILKSFLLRDATEVEPFQIAFCTTIILNH